MEYSNVVKLGGGVLGTGAVVGSAGYGVYEITNNENYKNLREKFEKEKKIVLKREKEQDYTVSVNGFSDQFAWQWLSKRYKDSENQNRRFVSFLNPANDETEILKKLQEKCSSVLDSSDFENEEKAVTWCTRSSSFLQMILNPQFDRNFQS